MKKPATPRKAKPKPARLPALTADEHQAICHVLAGLAGPGRGCRCRAFWLSARLDDAGRAEVTVSGVLDTGPGRDRHATEEYRV